MRTAILVVLTATEARTSFQADVNAARLAFKLASADAPEGALEIQLWESDRGLTKRKLVNRTGVAPRIEKFSRVDLPKDTPNTDDPNSFFARQNARILENKHRRSQKLPLLPLLVPGTPAATAAPIEPSGETQQVDPDLVSDPAAEDGEAASVPAVATLQPDTGEANELPPGFGEANEIAPASGGAAEQASTASPNPDDAAATDPGEEASLSKARRKPKR